MSDLLEHIQIETAPNPTAAVIWLHGLGASGNDFAGMPGELDLRGLAGIRFIFPHANQMPVTLNGGYPMRAWFDIAGTDMSQKEDEQGQRASQLLVEALIAREKARGIPASRIVLAGFSQGCVMTLHTGLRHPETLAGLMCLSGWLPLPDKVAAERTEASLATPIFQVHGRVDNVIPVSAATQSRDTLKALGYDVEWHEYMMAHQVCPEEVRDIGNWLRKVLA